MVEVTEKRLEELETKVTFQEDLLLKLDEMLIVHQKDLSRLKNQLALLTGQLQQLMRMLPEEPETPPPHY